MARPYVDPDSSAAEPDSGSSGIGESRNVAEQGHALWQQFAGATSPAEYYQSWLALQCQMVSNVFNGVIVLGSPDQGSFAPAAFWPDDSGDRQVLAEVCERALVEGRGLVLKRVASGIADGARQSCDHVAYPVHIDGQLGGVVALEVASRPERELQAVMSQLQWGSGWIELEQQRLAGANWKTGQARPRAVLELVASLVAQGDFQPAATTFVTELATRLGCERVSVGFIRRGHARIRAVSHSAKFDKKANLMRSIEAMMDESFDEEAVIVYPPVPGSSFRVMRAHEAHARQHDVGAVCSVPLSSEKSFVGVLTFERARDQIFEPDAIELCEAVGALAGPIMEVKRLESRWLVVKVLESFWSQLARLLGPHYMGRKLVITTLLALVVFFALAKGEYRVTATTVIEPVTRRTAVAPFNGYIGEALARAGDLVNAGDTLAILDDRDLRLERLKWLSQKQQYLKQRQVARSERNAAQVKIATAQIGQADAELALVDDQLARTQIRAPFGGMVVSGDLSQSVGAPVERGQTLFEVAPLDSYRAILQVDEEDIAELRPDQQGHLVLSTFPGSPLPITVERITPVSTAREGRNYFRVEARLDDASMLLRPGMEGVGKVDIDRRLLLWNWTHKAVNWLRLTFWSWLP